MNRERIPVMKLRPSVAAWLVASLACACLTLLLSAAPVCDPIAAGLVYLGVWGMGIATGLCVVGLIYEALH